MIEIQELQENGVLTFYSDGTIALEPYELDEQGREYIDLFPNVEAPDGEAAE